MKRQLIQLAKEAHDALENVKDADTLERLYKKYLGRKGDVTALLKKLSTLTPEERKELGQIANAIKDDIQELVGTKRGQFAAGGTEKASVDYYTSGHLK